MKSFKDIRDHFICEAITIGPRDLQRFIDTELKKLDALAKEAEGIRKDFAILHGKKRKGNEDGLDDFLSDEFTELSGVKYVTDVIDMLRFQHENRTSPPKDIRERIKDTARWIWHKDTPDHERNKWLSYLADEVRRGTEQEQYSPFFNWYRLNSAYDELKKLLTPSNIADYEKYSDMTKQEMKVFERLRDLIPKVKGELEFFNKRIQDYYKERQALRQYQLDRDTDAKTEVLYHASFKARELAKSGFQKNFKKSGMTGLGGSVSTTRNGTRGDGISFTYDLYVAKEIARSFKEVVLIAHGQLKWSEIREWSKKEGIWEVVWDTVSRERGWTTPENTQTDEYKKRMDTYKKFKETMGSLASHPPVVPKWTPFDVMKLYRVFLYLSKKRYNPVYFGDMEDLIKFAKTVNYRDVGVIEAEVIIGDVNQDSFYPGEKELRVTPEDIVRIIRVIQ